MMVSLRDRFEIIPGGDTFIQHLAFCIPHPSSVTHCPRMHPAAVLGLAKTEEACYTIAI